MSAPYDWVELLKHLQFAALSSSEQLDGRFTNPPAYESEIWRAEERVCQALPSSYKQFVLTSNGCGAISSTIWQLLPIEQIDLCLRKTPEFFSGWIDPHEAPISDSDYYTYGANQLPENFRSEYISHSVQVSAIGDSAAILLNPAVRTDNDEWEAWILATWFPGARRYRSFWELMVAQVST